MKPCGRQWSEMEQGGPYTWTCNDYRLCEMCKYKKEVKKAIKKLEIQLKNHNQNMQNSQTISIEDEPRREGYDFATKTTLDRIKQMMEELKLE